MGNLCSCCTYSIVLTLGVGSRGPQYEPLLLDNERDAVADLLQYLESTYHPLTQIVPRRTFSPESRCVRCLRSVSYTHLTLPTNREV